MEGDVFTISDRPADGSVDISPMRLRRCNGCVKCLTLTPGECNIEDGADDLLRKAMAHTELDIICRRKGDWFTTPMVKVAERLDNVLQAFLTDGGYTPLDPGSVSLKRIVVMTDGPEDPDFEANVRKNLLKGPVESVEFRYS